MNKTIKYESDFEFLGEVDRNPSNIKEAAKRLENNEWKLFYSLMYFDIKDDDDRKAMQHIKSKDFDSAIKIWEELIFEKSPIVYRKFGGITNILLNKELKIREDLFDVKVHQNTQNAYNPRHLITPKFKGENNHFFSVGLILPHQRRQAFSLIFKLLTNENSSNNVGISFGSNDFVHSYLIDLSGNLFIKEQLPFTAPIFLKPKNEIIESTTFDRNILKETNDFSVFIIDDIYEVWLNEYKIFSIKNTDKYKLFNLLLSGSATIEILSFYRCLLSDKKCYSLDISLNKITFSWVVNLSLSYLLKFESENKLDLPYDHYNFFDISSNYFKQDFFKEYSKLIIYPDYEIDFTRLTDIYVGEFFSVFKKIKESGIVYADMNFTSSIKNLSKEALKKTQDLIISPQFYSFDEKIRNIKNQRLNKDIPTKELIKGFIDDANAFFNWFLTMYGSYREIILSKYRNKVSEELLNCAIAYYNSSTKKSEEFIDFILDVFTKSAQYSEDIELRERILKNLNTVRTNRGWDIVEFEFTRNDFLKLIDFETYRSPAKNTTDSTDNVTNKSAAGNKNNSTNNDNTQRKKILKNTPIDLGLKSMLFNNASTKKEMTKSKPKLSFKRIGQIILVLIFLYSIFYIVSNSDTETSNTKNRASNQVYTQLNNGAAPYFKYFGYPAIDDYSDNSITFKNGNQTDVVVCLENVNSGRTIRHNYIRAGTSFTMGNLPDGLYKIKTFYGNDWDSTKKMKNDQIVGGFKRNAGYSVSGGKGDYISLSSSNDTYTNYTITLHTVQHGNMHQRSSNSSEFFK